MTDFIKTQAEFRNPDIPDVTWDSMSEEEQKQSLILRKFRFRLSAVDFYNEHANPDRTTIRSVHGDVWTINMSVDKMDVLVEKENNRLLNITKN